MAGYTFPNFATSTIAGGAGGSGTSLLSTDTSVLLQPGDGAKFGAPSSAVPEALLLGTISGSHELCKVTARSTDTLTIVRAQEGTAAQLWPVGTAVTAVVTAAVIGNLPPVFSVMAYGATGNGTTDDTTAIQAAITAAGAAGGGTVEFPPGTYQVSTPLTLSSPQVRLRGSGLVSWIRPTAGFVGAQIISITANFCGVSDLQVQFANGTYSANPAATGIQITGAVGTLLQNLYLQAINGWIVQSSATASQANFNTVISNVRGFQCAQGFHLLGVTGSSYNGVHFMRDCYSNQTQAGDCYLIEDFHDLVATDIFGEVTAGSGNSLHIKGFCTAIFFNGFDLGPFPGPTTGAAVLIESGANGAANQIVLNGGIIEGGTTDVSITAGTNIQIANCHIFNAGTFGINITGGDGILVTGCLFEANGSAGTTGRYDLQTSTTGHVEITGCYFVSPQGTTAGHTNNAINSTAGTVTVLHCSFFGTGYNGGNIFNSFPGTIRNCPGLNPIGAITAPTIGASPFTAPTQSFDMTVYITGGTVSAVKIGGTATGLTGGTFRVAAQQTIQITYTAAPTWVWIGD